MAKRLTEERIEKMAVEIRAFLLEHGIWQDTDIYFNGKRFTTRDPETKKYYYNDPEKLFVEDNQNPRDYFEYVADDHMINGYAYGGLVRRFHKIFEKYGVYYEQGDAWNLTCYYA